VIRGITGVSAFKSSFTLFRRSGSANKSDCRNHHKCRKNQLRHNQFLNKKKENFFFFKSGAGNPRFYDW